MRFDGKTYEPDKDRARLSTQLETVRDLMLDGLWRSLARIEALTGFPQASISARLRDLRKPRFGSWDVERRRRPGHQGTHQYRIRGKQRSA